MKKRIIFSGEILIVYCFAIIVLGCSNPHNVQNITTTWEFQSRKGYAEPLHRVDPDVLFAGEPTLALSGAGEKDVNGSWTHTYDVVPDRYYKFSTYLKPEDVLQLNRSVFVQITWQSEEGKQVGFVEFPAVRAEKTEDDWYVIRQTYHVPEKAVKAKIDLIYRWDADGKVFFGGTDLKEVSAVKPRLVRIAAIHHRPEQTTSSQESLDQFREFIEIAGHKNADIVCLSEGITIVGTDKSYSDVGESVPGPTTGFLGQLARKYSMYIVAGLYEKEDSRLYNTAVLIGRDGRLKGKYRKTALPREEIDAGLIPGDSFPVFDVDFGRIGMMICWDLHFPEVARMLALQGAEIILTPNWDSDVVLARARAIENQVYIVSSTYTESMKTGVFDRNGELIVEGTDENPVAVIEVDLNRRDLWPWVGEFRNRIQRELPDKKHFVY